MPLPIRHLALNADDVQRAKSFYETVFGWRLQPWGPPDYYQQQPTREGEPIIALHGRREFQPGWKMRGVEATIAVEDIAQMKAAVEGAGGRVVAEPYYIDGVGKLFYFADPEGNVLGAMQYDADADPH
jgi:predicted enzyme related to lactoylglutathione lyase